MNAKCEIHMSMLPNNNEPSYMLIVDDTHVLNLEYKDVVSIDKIKKMNTSLIWCPSKL